MKEDDFVAQLIIRKGEKVIRPFRLKADDTVLTIGLLPSSDIYLPDDKRFVSRTHAAIIRLDPQGKGGSSDNLPKKKAAYFIRDLGSAHGTKVGDHFIHKKILEEGDKIHISDYTLEFRQSPLSEDTIAGLPLNELFGKLPPIDIFKRETVLKSVKESISKHFTNEQQEFLLNVSKASLGVDFSVNPREFMGYLLALIRAEKALIGYCKNGKTYFTYQKGFERESPHCGEAFLSRLCEEGPMLQEGALWIPLTGKGFLALFRTQPPPFEENDLHFMRYVCEYLLQLNKHMFALRELTPWPTPVVGLADLAKKGLEIAGAENLENSDVLIIGETGTGKEVLARFIHENSARQNSPFFSLNCGALPTELAYSELFGYEKGAFTGAKVTKPGCFETARGGTLFLDEIGDMPETIQVALLTAMQQRKIQRLGSTKAIEVDVRIIAATDRDLSHKMQDDSFRPALFERFAYKLSIPPLRERKEEISLLAFYFLDKYSMDTRAISREALQCMREYDWPHNVRELQNVIKNAVLSKKEIIFSWDLPLKIQHARKVQDYQVKIQKTLKESEKDRIIKVMEETRGNADQMARILGISRATVYNKLKEYNISNLKDQSGR